MQLEEIKQIIDAYENNKPWQYTHGSCTYKCIGKTLDDNVPSYCEVNVAYMLQNPQYKIELLPNTIGNEVNGFNLPDGKKWHRDDFTPYHLKGGFRPLLEEEVIEAGDEVLCVADQKTWTAWLEHDINQDFDNAAKKHWSHHRTKRPIVPDEYIKHNGTSICPVDQSAKVATLYKDNSHNYNIQAFQVNWNQVTAYKEHLDPLKELKAAYKNGATIMFRYAGAGRREWKRAYIDKDGELGWHSNFDYKLAPKQIPLSRNDIAVGDVIKLDGRQYLVKYDSSIYDRDIAICNSFVEYASLQSRNALINRSFSKHGVWDENAWEPCYKDDPNS